MFAGPGVVSREAGAVVEDQGNPSMSDQPVQQQWIFQQVLKKHHGFLEYSEAPQAPVIFKDREVFTLNI